MLTAAIIYIQRFPHYIIANFKTDEGFQANTFKQTETTYTSTNTKDTVFLKLDGNSRCSFHPHELIFKPTSKDFFLRN